MFRLAGPIRKPGRNDASRISLLFSPSGTTVLLQKNVTMAEKYPFHNGALQKEGKGITDASGIGNSSLDDPLMNSPSFKNLT